MKPNKPTGAIITGKLKKTVPTLVHVHGTGYAAGFLARLRGKNTKQCWEGTMAASGVANLWSANVSFVACPRATTAKKKGKGVGTGVDEIAVTVADPADLAHPSEEIAVPGVEVP